MDNTLNIPETTLKRVVVIGGGFAGINFIKHIKDEKLQIVLLDRHNYHLFQPLLYQVATAGLEPGSIASPLRNLLTPDDDFIFRVARVDYIDQEKNRLKTGDGALAYDYLVIACGATPNFFGNKELSKTVHTLKTAEDAISIREYFFSHFEKAARSTDKEKHEKPLEVTIVGGGPTGVEVAGAIAELKRNILVKDYPTLNVDSIRITLVEALDRLLPAMSGYSGRISKKYLKKLGVEVKLGKMVNSYDGETIEFKDETTQNCDMLIWAAGVKGNLINGFTDDQIEKGQLLVDEFNRVAVYENVFAIGDIAFQKDKNYEKGLPMLAQVAIQQGNHLGKNFTNIINGNPLEPFRFKNKGAMATVGRNKAVVELSAKIKFGGFLGWLSWILVHLFQILGFRRKLVVMGHWIYSYFTYDKGNRIIIHNQP
ncbi:MAG TPA: FAD-dependent oxidoreductase [Cytophagales bacterium]|jgi:NADH dehydrogenase|nr:FAD-dependent oxidoreductase [Cytophagales bacterium]